MYITEYDENRVLAQQLEDGIEIGREEGREEGQFREKKATAKKLFNKGWTIEEIAEFEEVDVVDVKIWLNENDG